MRSFALDLTATQIASLTRLNRNTVNRYLTFIRQAIARFCEQEFPFSGDIELDESRLSVQSVFAVAVEHLVKRSSSASTNGTEKSLHGRVPDVQRKTLQAIIRGRVSIETVVHSDGWRGYNGLVDIGYPKHFRVNHSANEFANEISNINGIESFWSFAKRRLSKFNGVKKETFHLHLKESEFRFNHRNHNLYKLLLTLLRNSPL